MGALKRAVEVRMRLGVRDGEREKKHWVYSYIYGARFVNDARARARARE